MQDAPPTGGWAPLVCELLVEDLAASLAFWCNVLGFTVAYRRREQHFAYLERTGGDGQGPQVMLCQRSGNWETGPMQRPYGRGVMFQVKVENLQPVLDALAASDWPIHAPLREVWRRTGDVESGQREIFVLDPDGYLLMLAQPLGTRSLP